VNFTPAVDGLILLRVPGQAVGPNQYTVKMNHCGRGWGRRRRRHTTTMTGLWCIAALVVFVDHVGALNNRQNKARTDSRHHRKLSNAPRTAAAAAAAAGQVHTEPGVQSIPSLSIYHTHIAKTGGASLDEDMKAIKYVVAEEGKVTSTQERLHLLQGKVVALKGNKGGYDGAKWRHAATQKSSVTYVGREWYVDLFSICPPPPYSPSWHKDMYADMMKCVCWLQCCRFLTVFDDGTCTSAPPKVLWKDVRILEAATRTQHDAYCGLSDAESAHALTTSSMPRHRLGYGAWGSVASCTRRCHWIPRLLASRYHV
jgi:hypothetical protein